MWVWTHRKHYIHSPLTIISIYNWHDIILLSLCCHCLGVFIAYQLFQSVQQQRTPPLFAYQLVPPVIKWIFSPLLVSSAVLVFPPPHRQTHHHPCYPHQSQSPVPSCEQQQQHPGCRKGRLNHWHFTFFTVFLSVLSPNPNTPATFFKFSFSQRSFDTQQTDIGFTLRANRWQPGGWEQEVATTGKQTLFQLPFSHFLVSDNKPQLMI